MTTYLLKTEPNDYAYDDLVREKKTIWDGVANNAALIHLRAMKKGDEALIYHTGSEKRITGLASVVSNPYEDPQNPGETKDGAPKFAVVDIKPVKAATKKATLADIKADPRFEGFDLVRQPRLSVMPVPAKLDKALRKMAGL
jgi:predicted RNA-binding protein with PUA-like domain